MSSDNLFTVIKRFFDEYSSTTPQRLKLVDAYLAYVMLTGIVQFLYCLLVGTFPFNSFLSGFISCVGSFILAGRVIISAYMCGCVPTIIDNLLIFLSLHAVCLRIQSNPRNQSQFTISPERAFADFIFANIVLHLVVMNFIG